MTATRFLDRLGIFLLFMLLLSFGMVLHRMDELDKVEKEVHFLKSSRLGALEAKLQEMILEMEKSEDGVGSGKIEKSTEKGL